MVSVLLLGGCSGGADVKEELGLRSPPPDEFSVVTRAPLEVPPDFTLRPPRPGAERPNEISVREQTKQTVFGKSDKAAATASTGEGAFLSKLGANQANPSVRDSIDTEIQDLEKKEQPVAEKMLFWKKKAPLGKAIDPVAEQKRLEAEGFKNTTPAEPAAAPSTATTSKTTSTTTTKTSSKKPGATTIQKRNEDILQSE